MLDDYAASTGAGIKPSAGPTKVAAIAIDKRRALWTTLLACVSGRDGGQEGKRQDLTLTTQILLKSAPLLSSTLGLNADASKKEIECVHS